MKREVNSDEITAGDGPICIKVRGIVQGVGFRPFIYNLASAMGLRGTVANTSDGVEIVVDGPEAANFLKRMLASAPPLARITSLEVESAEPLIIQTMDGFKILKSKNGQSFTLLSYDVSTCDECMRELLDSSDRRHGYPFINCTNCGPRYTITLRTPYDRPNTTMQKFTMCGECQAEYDDPKSRRFHAVPNACSKCGPRVWLSDGEGDEIKGEINSSAPINEAVSLMKAGKIIAMKGMGGFHLACDAKNPEAVKRLRDEKRRSNKPFALMAQSMDVVRKYCEVNKQEEALISSARRPVVLLRKKGEILPDAISPGNAHYGFMLPYTPLHSLLFQDDTEAVFVMTSGNASDEPIQITNVGALAKLAHLADAFLLHDRDIFMRVDDSVLRVAPGTGRAAYIRRARGFAPEPIPLLKSDTDSLPDILAVGADLKNTFTVAKGEHAIVSQHIGDMENYETIEFFKETLDNLKSVYRVEPVAIAHDMHPGYNSTKWAIQQEVKKFPVQHHYAHIASVMAERGLKNKVIGVALDGTGYGPDGTLWGGEFLVADLNGYTREGHFEYVRLPGGQSAIKEPWRIAVSYINDIYGSEAPAALQRLGFMERYGEGEVHNVLRVAGMKEFSPLSCGAGRLFDAVSAIVGVRGVNTFEGEAAMALEGHVDMMEDGDYPVDLGSGNPIVVDFTYTILSIIKDMQDGVSPTVISARFHNSVTAAVVGAVKRISSITGVKDVVLSGGVFQNNVLLGRTMALLIEGGMNPHINEIVPANDGGISLGQAYLLRHQI